MRDAQIRTELRAELEARFPSDRLIRNELGLCLGATRVDVAVVNGDLHGYEIKSERDTLVRLRSQVALYDSVLDYCWVVSSGRHLEKVAAIVPSSWGLMRAVEGVCGVLIEDVRQAGRNPRQDPLSVAQLLWRDEAASSLRDAGHRVRSSETRWVLWERLAGWDLDDLKVTVRRALKARRAWPGG